MDSPPEIPLTLSDQDASHLSLLAVFYHVLAGFTFLLGCIPIIYLAIGIAMLTNPEVFAPRGAPAMEQFQTHEEMQEQVLFGDTQPPLRAERAERDPMSSPQDAPPQENFSVLGGVLVGIAVVVILLGWAVAAAFVFGGRSIQRRKHHVFCQAVGGIACLCFPLGTVLGVMTIVVLQRPAVAAVFKRGGLSQIE